MLQITTFVKKFDTNGRVPIRIEVFKNLKNKRTKIYNYLHHTVRERNLGVKGNRLNRNGSEK